MALIVTIPASENPAKVDIPGAYARVVKYEGDKHKVQLTVASWLNQESAQMDGEPVCVREYVFAMPEMLATNPVAWAYQQLKESGQLGETRDI